MAASTQILRQYLLSIGFQVDEKGGKTLDTQVTKLDKAATKLAYSFVTTGIAAAAMVTQFSRQMERLYYSSKKAESAAGNIQALEYMGQQIGLGAGQMTASLEAMARNLRANPGLIGLLENLGVPVAGRDKADVMLDLVKALKGMPFYVAQQFAQLFGVDPDQLLLLEQSVDELEKLRDERKKMAESAGVDMEAAAAAGKEYAQQWRQINEQVGLFKDALMLALLPVMRSLSVVTKEVLKDWTQIVQRETPGSFFEKLAEGLGLKASRASTGQDVLSNFTPEARRRLAAMQAAPTAPNATPASPGGMSPIEPSHFDRLEAQYGLPPGILDKIWNQESRRGRYMTSPKGARGHFGFMPQTQAELGLTDPNDLEASSTAAAKYLSMLQQRYGGDIQKALAAYNWGMGNVDKKGLGAAPWETRNYVQSISGQPLGVTQQNTFIINGAQSPNATAAAVADRMGSTNAELTRNLRGSLQ